MPCTVLPAEGASTVIWGTVELPNGGSIRNEKLLVDSRRMICEARSWPLEIPVVGPDPHPVTVGIRARFPLPAPNPKSMAPSSLSVALKLTGEPAGVSAAQRTNKLL